MRACDHRWEVEALRDQRLGDDDRTRVQRHIAGCSDCTREQHEIQRLGAALSGMPEQSVDELTVRRRRAALLARAHENSVGPQRKRPVFATMALLAAGVGIGVVWMQPRQQSATSAPQAQLQTSAPEVTITADSGALYTRDAGPEGTIVQLARGRITLEVRGAVGHTGVVVRTPDGEIVDRGTIFSVAVEAGQTRSVEVTQGSVAVRINGLSPRVLQAGERFSPYELALQEPSPAAPAQAPGARHGQDKSVHRAVKAPANTGVAAPEKAQTEHEFEQAMAALSEGRLHESVEGFSHFLEHCGDDARAEDAAFLQIVALERSHREVDAKRAGERYLGRFPRGLRVREVQRLIDAP